MRIYGTHLDAASGAVAGLVFRGSNAAGHPGLIASLKNEDAQAFSNGAVRFQQGGEDGILDLQCSGSGGASTPCVEIDSASGNNIMRITVTTGTQVPFSDGTTAYKDAAKTNQITWGGGTQTPGQSIDGLLVMPNSAPTCASNLSFSANWGTSPVCAMGANVTENKLTFTVTAESTTGASPTFTYTFPIAMTATPQCLATMTGGTGTFTMISNNTQSASAPVFTFNGTPAASSTYIIQVQCGP